MAWKVMPMRRKGRDKSQTRGKRSKAIKARGQQSRKRMHQATKRIRAFIPFAAQYEAMSQASRRVLTCAKCFQENC